MESNAKSKGRKSYKLCEDLKIPKLLTYTKLIKYITSVNVGNVKQLSELCDVVEQVNGAYRELDDFLPILAELYIELDKVLGSNSYLMNFGYDYYKFLVAIGADGALLLASMTRRLHGLCHFLIVEIGLQVRTRTSCLLVLIALKIIFA